MSADRKASEFAGEHADELFAEMFETGTGYCVYCEEEVDQVEPDVTERVCPCCGKHGVYGVEALILLL